MKLLQNSKLESIGAALCVNAGDCVLNGRSVSMYTVAVSFNYYSILCKQVLFN